MNDTENKTGQKSPNGGPGHMRPTGAYPTVPLMEALARRGVHVPTPPPIQPQPVDPAHPNANSTHVWPVGNMRPTPSPAPRPPVPAVDVTPPATRPDWRDRLSALPWPARIAGIITLVAGLIVAAVLAGAGS